MDETKIKTIKKRCEICGKTVKCIVIKPEDETEAFNKYFNIYLGEDGKYHSICKQCDRTYRITDNYNGRGYGYAGTTCPKSTKADKNTTPTYGLELEVAGNISNIDKIAKLADNELTIGYDTSVEGAQFELSYCPGTYYWYKYESKLQGICNLLKKDKWVKHNSKTTGMHIHVGNIDKHNFMISLIYEEVTNPYMWVILSILGERALNQYCQPYLLNGHHDAISWSEKWGTIEFRFFKMEYNFEKIMQRIKFIRQILDNARQKGIEWWNFKEESKNFFFELLKSNKGIRKELKEKIKEIFEKKQEKELDEEQIRRINNEVERLENTTGQRERRPYWIEEDDEEEQEEDEEYESF